MESGQSYMGGGGWERDLERRLSSTIPYSALHLQRWVHTNVSARHTCSRQGRQRSAARGSIRRNGKLTRESLRVTGKAASSGLFQTVRANAKWQMGGHSNAAVRFGACFRMWPTSPSPPARRPGSDLGNDGEVFAKHYMNDKQGGGVQEVSRVNRNSGDAKNSFTALRRCDWRWRSNAVKSIDGAESRKDMNELNTPQIRRTLGRRY